MSAAKKGFYFTGDSGTGLFHPAVGTLSLSTLGMQRVRVADDGNVAVGEDMAYPLEKLHVSGNVFAEGRFFSPAATSHPTFSFRGDRETGMYSPALGSVAFSTQGTQRMRLYDNGNVGIGAFGSGAAAQEELDVIGNAQVSGQLLLTTRDTPAIPTYSWSKDEDTGMYNPHPDTLAVSTGGKERLRVTQDGKIGVNTNAPSDTLTINGSLFASGDVKTRSDRRVKRDIHAIDGALHKLVRLTGTTYFMNDADATDARDKRCMGVVAQDAEHVVPEVVHYDAKNDIYSLNYQGLVALVIEATKEMHARFRDEVTDLRRRFARQDAILTQLLTEKNMLGNV